MTETPYMAQRKKLQKLRDKQDGEMKKPEKAKTKPKRIVGRGEPGGPHTPGAKKKRKKKAKKKGKK
jgi:hypothetical protein